MFSALPELGKNVLNQATIDDTGRLNTHFSDFEEVDNFLFNPYLANAFLNINAFDNLKHCLHYVMCIECRFDEFCDSNDFGLN